MPSICLLENNYLQAMLGFGLIYQDSLQHWQAECVRELERSGFARLRSVVRAPAVVATATPYDALCAEYGVSSQATINVSSLRPHEGANDGEALDFALLFADHRFGRRLVPAPRLGVWYFLHGDIAVFSSRAPGFWEISRDHDVTGATLVQLRTPDVAGVALKSGYLATKRESFRDNVESILDTIKRWPAQVCAEIARNAATYFEDEPVAHPPIEYQMPTRRDVLGMRFAEFRNKAAARLHNRFFSIDWHVGRLHGSGRDYIDRDEPADVMFVCPNAKGKYLADPCVVSSDSKTYVFCEEYWRKGDRGVLVASDLSNAPKLEPRVVMPADHHLSYPHIFEHDGDLYCIPESGSIRRADLYRCLRLPDRWSYVTTLIDDFAARDATLVRHEKKFWLFCTSDELGHRGYNSHLYVWHADDLFGPWRPHLRNPVKIDARSARPAGNFFLHDGALYRPSQDCGRNYGSAIRINRVDLLTERDFKETVAGVIRPPAGRYDKGIHTISSAGDWCMVDAKRYLFNPYGVVEELKLHVKSALIGLGVPETTLLNVARRLRNERIPKLAPVPEPAPVPAVAQQGNRRNA